MPPEMDLPTQNIAPTGGRPPGAPKPDMASSMAVPMLLSPPGQQAPVGLTNYTPSSKMLHPTGRIAPIGDMNLTPLGPKQLQALKAALANQGRPKPGGGPMPSPAPQATQKPPQKPTLKPPSRPAPKKTVAKLRPPAVG